MANFVIMCFLRNPLLWFVFLASYLIFAVFSGCGILSFFLTTSALILGTALFTLLTPRSIAAQKSLSRESKNDSDEINHIQKKEAEEIQFSSESGSNITQEKRGQQRERNHVCDYLNGSPEALSDSESLDHTSTSEDSRSGWQFRETRGCSSGSISDEESLIEIALTNGHFDGPKQQSQQHHWPDHCSMFGRQSLMMELQAEINEMNEEDNLMEIDITMGSIKCSRFEIKA
ncbi:hypothetical protein Nepgr_000597 [Nepenthes gracilis]|uniref:Uncharacterized protein n=1 Tax=Nepenthes gracilis TaxID=150966 RepID=A0AAD3RX01_NEPGR|nr:hypothetical protein Nepgr_000597 [Nepenthes gracilis]